jgi:excisionase family DNA binding protein
MNDELLTPEELAGLLKIPRDGVYRLSGPRTVRLGRRLRFRRSDVDAWLAEQARDESRIPGGRGGNPR